MPQPVQKRWSGTATLKPTRSEVSGGRDHTVFNKPRCSSLGRTPAAGRLARSALPKRSSGRDVAYRRQDFYLTAGWHNIPPPPHLAPPGLLKCHMCCHQSKQRACVSAWQHGEPPGEERRTQQGQSAGIPGHAHRHYLQAEKPHVACSCVWTRWTLACFWSTSPVIYILRDSLGLMLKENDRWLISLIFLL